jgi:hypothetical protein
MKKRKRIAELERRVAEPEAELAIIRARQVYDSMINRTVVPVEPYTPPAETIPYWDRLPRPMCNTTMFGDSWTEWVRAG